MINTKTLNPKGCMISARLGATPSSKDRLGHRGGHAEGGGWRGGRAGDAAKKG